MEEPANLPGQGRVASPWLGDCSQIVAGPNDDKTIRYKLKQSMIKYSESVLSDTACI
jgi:hypothetical protein